MRIRTNKKVVQGFTLVEAVVALLLFAVLAGIAYPTYVDAVRKGKRVEGRAAMFLLMQQQERYYSQHNTYVAFSVSSTDAGSGQFKWYSGSSPKASAYEIKAEACDQGSIRDCVQLVAMPGTGNVDGRHEDPVCGRLILISTGTRSARRPDCWQ